MKSHKRTAAAVLSIAIAGGLLGCSGENPLDLGDSPAEPVITIGSQGTPESEILAQIYGQVLEDAGYPVDYDLAIGPRSEFFAGLADGGLGLVPETTGSLLYALDLRATATAPDAIAAALPAAIEQLGLSITVLDASEAESADALVVTPEFAAANNVSAIGDLAGLEGAFTLGAGENFETSQYGRAGLTSVYGVTGWTFTPIDDNGGPQTIKKLLDGDIQVADVHMTAPSIRQNKLVVLDDPGNLIAAQNIIPLVDADVITGDLARLVDAVSAKLTTEGLLELNLAYVGKDQPSAASLATGWLIANGFIADPAVTP